MPNNIGQIMDNNITYNQYIQINKTNITYKYIYLFLFLENYDWNIVSILPIQIIGEPYFKTFQYKVLNRINGTQTHNLRITRLATQTCGQITLVILVWTKMLSVQHNSNRKVIEIITKVFVKY